MCGIWGDDQAVAEANQVLFFNASEGYRVSHPVPGGDASLTLIISESQLRELAPRALLRDRAAPAFRQHRLRIDARAQVAGGAPAAQPAPERRRTPGSGKPRPDPGAARAGAAHHTRAPAPASDGSGWWIARSSCWRAIWRGAGRWPRSPPRCAAPLSTSPRSSSRSKACRLYRYQLRLRLARALDLLGQYDDLTGLSLDLGFSSHSHFSAAFRPAYGRSPSEFRRTALHR